MKKEVGSNFWIAEDFYKKKTYDEKSIYKKLGLGPNSCLFSAARQAVIYSLRDMDLAKKRALIPEYTCHSVIEPFLSEGYEVFYYSVDRNLRVKLSEINKLIKKYDISVFLFHPYFGFDTIVQDEKLDTEIKVIYDATQAMYSDFDYDFYDYKVGSIRKWGPVLDGAYGEKRRGEFKEDFNFEPDLALEKVMEEASALKSDYMVYDRGEKPVFLNLYAKGLGLIRQRDGINDMSPKSKLIQDNLDLDQLKEKRRENFAHLLAYDGWDRIGEPVFEDLTKEAVPLYFPLHLKVDRKKFQKHLAENNIYAPIIWSKPDLYETREVDADVDWIYQHTLSIPIDQRYDLDDMERILEVVADYGEDDEK